MKISTRITALAAALALALAATASAAQAAPAVITVPPRTFAALPMHGPVAGADSTLFSAGIPGPRTSSISIPSSGSGGGSGGGGGTVCTPGQTQACASNACPAGYTGLVAASMTCTASGTWPSACTPTPAMIAASPTSYGCTAQVCVANASEPAAACGAPLTCPPGYTGTPSYTCTCNSTGSGSVSSPTQATVTSNPTAYGCTATATCRHLGSVSQIQGHWCCQEQWDPSSGTCGTLYTYCTSLTSASMPVGLCPTYGAPAPSGEVLCNTLGTTVAWCPGS
jgi:hypothetical protein